MSIHLKSKWMTEHTEDPDKQEYDDAYAFVQLVKSSSIPVITHALEGRLYVSESGWGRIAVPAALVRGAFDAMGHVGIELPINDKGRIEGHISVFSPSEIEQIGGADKITEVNHSFKYSLGPIQEYDNPAGMPNLSKAYAVSVDSPELRALRKSYALPPEPKCPLHITVATRRKNVLYNNQVAKTSSALSIGKLLEVC